jgi:hypothetical protein
MPELSFYASAPASDASGVNGILQIDGNPQGGEGAESQMDAFSC